MQDAIQISVVILNFNGKQFLDDCLTSVLREAGPEVEVILVDNASSDGSVQHVKSSYPRVQIVESQVNLGFAGGNNLGVARAQGDYVVLLNNDTVVQPGWLEGLKRAIEPEDVAIASSLVRTEGVPERYYERNGSINFLGHNIMTVFTNPEDIFYAGGASLVYKKKLLGLPFDEMYFAYAEDVYLSLRARFLGYRVVHTNDSRVLHLGGGTTARGAFRRRLLLLQERNRLLNILLFFSGRTILKVLPLMIFNCVVKSVTGLLGTRYSFLATTGAYVWLLTHIDAIRSKRTELRGHRWIDECDVISQMCGRLTQGESVAARWLNRASIRYCRVVGLRTIEIASAAK